jgi:transposase
MGKIERIEVPTADRERLETLVRDRNTPQKVVWRARIVLLTGEGLRATEVAARVGTSTLTVRRWRRRYAQAGVEGLLKDATRPPGRKPLTAAVIRRVLHLTLHEKPPRATQWSVRSLADAVGLSHTSVQRIWHAHGLKPHLVRTFKLSTDKRFVEKVQDVVGLYLDPPDKALVLAVDEKSQIQALDRTQPGLPLKKGRAGTMLGTCMKRHRHQEFLRFLREINRATPRHLDLHLIVDNYATHKHPKVKAWLAKHPRFHLHFTPTSASWLNLVERFFALITQERIRRGAFSSVPDLESAIMDYLENHNADPKPFVWTASASAILQKVARAKQALESQH